MSLWSVRFRTAPLGQDLFEIRAGANAKLTLTRIQLQSDMDPNLNSTPRLIRIQVKPLKFMSTPWLQQWEQDELNQVNVLSLVMCPNVSEIRSIIMSPIAERESALFHVLLQINSVRRAWSKPVGHGVLSLHSDSGQLSSSDLLLYPQLPHFNMSNSPSTSPK